MCISQLLTITFLSFCRCRGRKKMALLFCLTSSTASLIRLSSNYHYLVVSHLLSGLSTALLYCVFEAWYISQHQRKGKSASPFFSPQPILSPIGKKSKIEMKVSQKLTTSPTYPSL